MIECQPLSGYIKRLIVSIMRNKVEGGFMYIHRRNVAKVFIDEEAITQLLLDCIIKKENVLKYLHHSYYPVKIENGLRFTDKNGRPKSCLQHIKRTETGFKIYIINSEPHKIGTDLIYSMQRYKEFYPEDIIPENVEILLMIEQIKIAYQETIVYCECIKGWNMPLPSEVRLLAKKTLDKFDTLEKVAAIKMRSIKRKFLKYYVKMKYIKWEDLRRIIAIDDYSPIHIKEFIAKIKEENDCNGKWR